MPTEGAAIKTLLTVLFLGFVLMALLGLVRVPFAVRFWRRMQWLMWVYLAVVVAAAVRIYFIG